MIRDKFKSALISAAQPIIDDVRQKKTGRMKHTPNGEIDFVASLIETGVGRIEKAWQGILSAGGGDIQVADLFCHQSPRVRIDLSRRCELADLLLIHFHDNAAGKEYWRAILMQAKVCASGARMV